LFISLLCSLAMSASHHELLGLRPCAEYPLSDIISHADREIGYLLDNGVQAYLSCNITKKKDAEVHVISLVACGVQIFMVEVNSADHSTKLTVFGDAATHMPIILVSESKRVYIVLFDNTLHNVRVWYFDNAKHETALDYTSDGWMDFVDLLRESYPMLQSRYGAYGSENDFPSHWFPNPPGVMIRDAIQFGFRHDLERDKCLISRGYIKYFPGPFVSADDYSFKLHDERSISRTVAMRNKQLYDTIESLVPTILDTVKITVNQQFGVNHRLAQVLNDCKNQGFSLAFIFAEYQVTEMVFKSSRLDDNHIMLTMPVKHLSSKLQEQLYLLVTEMRVDRVRDRALAQPFIEFSGSSGLFVHSAGSDHYKPCDLNVKSSDLVAMLDGENEAQQSAISDVQQSSSTDTHEEVNRLTRDVVFLKDGEPVYESFNFLVRDGHVLPNHLYRTYGNFDNLSDVFELYERIDRSHFSEFKDASLQWSEAHMRFVIWMNAWISDMPGRALEHALDSEEHEHVIERLTEFAMDKNRGDWWLTVFASENRVYALSIKYSSPDGKRDFIALFNVSMHLHESERWFERVMPIWRSATPAPPAETSSEVAFEGLYKFWGYFLFGVKLGTRYVRHTKGNCPLQQSRPQTLPFKADAIRDAFSLTVTKGVLDPMLVRKAPYMPHVDYLALPIWAKSSFLVDERYAQFAREFGKQLQPYITAIGYKIRMQLAQSNRLGYFNMDRAYFDKYDTNIGSYDLTMVFVDDQLVGVGYRQLSKSSDNNQIVACSIGKVNREFAAWLAFMLRIWRVDLADGKAPSVEALEMPAPIPSTTHQALDNGAVLFETTGPASVFNYDKNIRRYEASEHNANIGVSCLSTARN